MRNYYKVMLGPKSSYVKECVNGNFIGADYGIRVDLTDLLSKNWQDFNHAITPIYLADNPDKSKVAAGQACGSLWTMGKVIQKGDIIVCPNGKRVFLFGEVTSDYSYHPDEILPHRRSVKWYSASMPRGEVSTEMNESTFYSGTIANISKHATEIEAIIVGNGVPAVILSKDPTIEDPSEFAFEEHLEDFLVKNWPSTEIGKNYDIYAEDGEFGRQYKCDTGFIDILAISKDKKELLVVELKKGRASDSVVGQIQRYMGFIKAERTEPGQIVKGIIIASEDDNRIKRALSVTNNIDFYQYKISFKLTRTVV